MVTLWERAITVRPAENSGNDYTSTTLTKSLGWLFRYLRSPYQDARSCCLGPPPVYPSLCTSSYATMVAAMFVRSPFLPFSVVV
jgi:hypothetical protein